MSPVGISRCIVAIVCFSGAVYLIIEGKEGWGWLIFGGLCAIPPID